MQTAKSIKSFIMNSAGQLFTSSQVLHLGSRNAVDKALGRFVKLGLIKRLANGVFVKADSEQKSASIIQIMKAKASAFKKVIFECGQQVFHTDGCRSAFGSIHGRLFFKTTCPRKLRQLAEQYDSRQATRQDSQASDSSKYRQEKKTDAIMLMLSLALKLQTRFVPESMLAHIATQMKRIRGERKPGINISPGKNLLPSGTNNQMHQTF